MLTTLSIVFGFLYLLLIGFQIAFVTVYKNSLVRRANVSVDEKFQPSVAVVLCLRGADPSLDRCLASLATQEYPPFQLYCVVDSPDDQSLKTVAAKSSLFQSSPVILQITDISQQRSLKCSALLTAFEHLRKLPADERFDVIAMVDADTCCDPKWLQDLVAPLADTGVGAACGNRWYSPPGNAMGSWVRKTWNAAAIVQMYLYNVAWGGTFAFRTELLNQSSLMSRLETMFCEDTGINEILAENGQVMVRVPNLVLNNSESTTLPNATSFITRQLFNMRLYHWAWFLVAGHAAAILGLNVAAIAAIVAAISAANVFALSVLASGFVLLQLSNILLLRQIENVNVMFLKERWGQDKEFRSNSAANIPGIMLTQIVHPYAVLRACLTAKVSWRGIEYEVQPGGRISMVQYKPFDSNENKNYSVE